MPAGEVPGVRSSAASSDKGAICEAGRERRLCLHFTQHGPDGCYFCGYLDGYRDGIEDSDRLWDIEERYGGLE